MTDKERIALLEEQVKELQEKLKSNEKPIIEWRNMSAYLEEKIKEIFNQLIQHINLGLG